MGLSPVEMSKLKTRWQGIEIKGLPPADSDPYYKDRYSVPVLAGNCHTGGVDIVAYRYSYLENGWVYATLSEGPSIHDYEVLSVTHWALWPSCKLVTLDGGK